jgi:phosphatidyl-myo-inositol dimannoside synthase
VAKKTLFLTLRVFSAMGGIERVCCIFGKSLYEIHKQDTNDLRVYSMYDTAGEIDERYFPSAVFKGFGKNRNRFIVESISKGIKSDIVIISHINLLLVAFAIKLCSPKTKLILIAHGIEVWKKFPFIKRFALKHFEVILPVSRFTSNKLARLNRLPEKKFNVLNNCLDPFLLPAISGPKDPRLMEKYGFKQDDIILVTITRLSKNEKYKNCDKVLETMQRLSTESPKLKYLLVGAYDIEEKIRIEKISKEMGLEGAVIITGFIPDSEFPLHYNIADIFIMLSEREGFGIVFIEAMYYGKPVIGADNGGVADALANGKLGILVNPLDTGEVALAIKTILSDRPKYTPNRSFVLDRFGYDAYKNKLEHIIDAL